MPSAIGFTFLTPANSQRHNAPESSVTNFTILPAFDTSILMICRCWATDTFISRYRHHFTKRISMRPRRDKEHFGRRWRDAHYDWLFILILPSLMLLAISMLQLLTESVIALQPLPVSFISPFAWYFACHFHDFEPFMHVILISIVPSTITLFWSFLYFYLFDYELSRCSVTSSRRFSN